MAQHKPIHLQNKMMGLGLRAPLQNDAIYQSSKSYPKGKLHPIQIKSQQNSKRVLREVEETSQNQTEIIKILTFRQEQDQFLHGFRNGGNNRNREKKKITQQLGGDP